MRAFVLAATVALAAAAAQAQPPSPAPPAPPPTPPRVFLAAGYSEPDITPGYCHNVDANQTQCTLPGMTAGRYIVAVGATSTATAADAAQQIIIVAGDQTCTSTRAPDPKTPWAVGTKRTFYSACAFTIVTYTPLTVTGIYKDANATKEPKGPVLSVSRQPWNGVLAATPLNVRQL